jgi:hypothetical protein
MSNLGWTILLVGLALAAEVTWAEFREGRARRDAARRGRGATRSSGAR